MDADKRDGSGCRNPLILVPKLLLGNAIFLPQLGWGTSSAGSRKILSITLFAKRSLASKGVPKQELGNQKISGTGFQPVRRTGKMPRATKELWESVPGYFFSGPTVRS